MVTQWWGEIVIVFWDSWALSGINFIHKEARVSWAVWCQTGGQCLQRNRKHSLTSIWNSPIAYLDFASAGWPLTLTDIDYLRDLGYVLSNVLSICLSVGLTIYLPVCLFACNGTAQAAWMCKPYFLGFLFRLCDPKPMSSLGSYICCIWTFKTEGLISISEAFF